MKRYISMSLSLLVLSLVNMLTWLCLGFTMGNPNLSSVFSLVYPIWFIVGVFLSMFGTGANVRKNKKNDETQNSVFSGMLWAIVFGSIVFVCLAVFSDDYVKFMNMDVAVFGTFAKFSMLEALAWMIFQLVLEKLYFEEKDTEANIHGVAFYVLSFVSLVVCSLITKNETIIIAVTLSLLYLYTAILFLLNIRKFKFEWNFFPNIKYDAVSLCGQLLFFITYFVGYSNAFQAGEKYIIAINLVNLVTDPQWDATEAISKIAKIDLSKNNFNFKSAIKKSAILTFGYAASSIILFFSLFNAYGVTLWIGVTCLLIQVADMLVDIFIPNIRNFLQLEFSATLTTSIHLTLMALRATFSVVVVSPFNTNIAQIGFDCVALIIFAVIVRRFFKLEKSGHFIPRKKKIKIDDIVLYVDRKVKVE